MSQHAARQRRSSSKLQGRGIPQTVSQLSGGLSSTPFFTSKKPSAEPTLSPPRDNSQAASELTPNTRASTPTAPEVPSASPSPFALKPSASFAPATHAPASIPSTLPQIPSSSDPARVPEVNNNIILAGTTVSKNPPTSSSPQPSALLLPIRQYPDRSVPSESLSRRPTPLNLIETLVVVGVGLTLLFGGIFFCWFRVKRGQRRTTVDEGSSESDCYAATNKFHHPRNRSGSSLDSNRVLNWPIDKKSIKIKRDPHSIISYGPGHLPEFPRYPNNVMTLTTDPQNCPPTEDKHRLSDHTTHASSKYEQSKNGNETSIYDEEEKISHIPISYEVKPPKARQPVPNHPTRPPYETMKDDDPPMVFKKTDPKRYTKQISKAARKLAPGRLVSISGVEKSKIGTLPLSFNKKKKTFQPSQTDTQDKSSKPFSDNKSSLYPGDSDYPLNYSYYHGKVDTQIINNY